MEKYQFKELLSSLKARAHNNQGNKQVSEGDGGDRHPNLARIHYQADDIEGVKSYDKVLASKLLDAERALNDLDQYVLTKFEQNS